MMVDNIIRDSLYNCHPDCANSKERIEYGRGVLVGLVSGIMATKHMNFAAAINFISAAYSGTYPSKRIIVKDCVPESWRKDFEAMRFYLT